MRGVGKYQKKKMEETCNAVFWAIFENGPVTFTQLYRLLKSQGVLNSTRTLAKALRRLQKAGRVKKEPACLHLNSPKILNPPIIEQGIVFGGFEGRRFIPNRAVLPKIVHALPYPPENPRAWKAKLNRLILGRKKVYVVKIKTFIKEKKSSGGN